MSNKGKTHYDVLGISADATDAQVKEAYRKVAKQTHPDLVGPNFGNARFVEVSEAIDILGCPEKRRVYDMGLPGTRVINTDEDIVMHDSSPSLYRPPAKQTSGSETPTFYRKQLKHKFARTDADRIRKMAVRKKPVRGPGALALVVSVPVVGAAVWFGGLAASA